MRKTLFLTLILWTTLFIANAQSACDTTFVRVKTANGTIEGFELMGIRFFRGVPYAQPPVGDLRWKEPRPFNLGAV